MRKNYGGDVLKDSELARKLALGDKDAARELIDNYGPMLRYIIFPILKDEREREECFNDVIMRSMEKIGGYSEEKGSFKSWLSVLTRNTALNRARKLRREPDSESISENMASKDNPEEELIKSEILKKLEDAVSNLSERDKALFYRRFYYCQSISQIAAETGMTQRAAEGRLYRLKKKLRKELGGEDRE